MENPKHLQKLEQLYLQLEVIFLLGWKEINGLIIVWEIINKIMMPFNYFGGHVQNQL